MKILAIALGMTVISSVALAQVAQPLSGPPASGPASQQQAPAAGTAPSQARTFVQCRDEARNQRLRGDERKNFMRDCAREITTSCRDQAKSQRLDRDARRDFMASCTGRPARNAQRRGPNAVAGPDNAQPSGNAQAPAPR